MGHHFCFSLDFLLSLWAETYSLRFNLLVLFWLDTKFNKVKLLNFVLLNTSGEKLRLKSFRKKERRLFWNRLKMKIGQINRNKWSSKYPRKRGKKRLAVNFDLAIFVCSVKVLESSFDKWWCNSCVQADANITIIRNM